MDNQSQPTTLDYQQTFANYLRFRNDFSKNTALTARHSINVFINWLSVRELNERNVLMFVAEITKNKSPGYVGRVVKHLQYFTAWLTKAGYLKEDPAINAKRPRIYSKDPKPGYTLDEYRSLRDFFKGNPHMRTFVIIAYHTGMAMVDVCGLMWGEVNLDRMLITRVRKKMAKRTGSTSIIPIISGSDLDIELRRLAAINPTGPNCYVDPLLAAYHMGMEPGGNQCGNSLKNKMRWACQKLGIEVKGTHGFRRGMCTALANDPTVNPFHAAAVTGHSSLQMLKRYATMDPKRVAMSTSNILARHFSEVVDEG